MNPKFMQTIAIGTKKALVILSAKAPTILTVTGIGIGIASTVVAVKRSPKISEIKEKYKKDIEAAENCLNNKTVETKDGKKIEYTDSIYQKDVRIITGKKVLGYIRVYAPAIIFGLASISCVLTGHHMMKARNAALTATIASVSEAFHRYRDNVKLAYGDEADWMMRHNMVPTTETVKVTDIETGKVKTEKKVVMKQRNENVNHRGNSDYSRCYSEGCSGWTKNAEMNKMQLMNIESWCNWQLEHHGYLFLNDVYKQLGFEQTKAGSEMGWIFYKNEENPYGDNHISFGFDRVGKFMEGAEYSVWLDFNVDDLPIKDRIKWKTI